MGEEEGVQTANWDGYLREGPGAVTTAVPLTDRKDPASVPLPPEGDMT